MQEVLDRYFMLMTQGNEIRNLVALITLCSARLLALMFVVPALASTKLTGAVRSGLPIWMGMFVAWGQPLDVVDGLTVPGLALLILKEALLGFLIGFAAATIFWVAEGVGSLIDNMAGFNNVQQSNPNSSDQSTPVGNFMSELSIYAFYQLGGLTALLGLVFASYGWWPVNLALPAGAPMLERFVLVEVTQYMLAVARLAAPALLVLLLIDLGIGLLTKAAEKLEPNNLAQPIKGAVTMVLLSLLLGAFFQQLRGELALTDFAPKVKSLVDSARR